MKLTRLLFTMLIINTLASCSTENENQEEIKPATSILVKKIIHTYRNNEVEISTIKYNGNKIISRSTEGGFIATYTYTGDVITKIEERVNDRLQRSLEYFYLNGKVIRQIENDNLETDSRTFTYNTNGTVSYARSRTRGENTTGLLTFENGNLIKNEEFFAGQFPSSSIYEFAYDTKNNPFKNVIGFNLLFDTNRDTFSSNNMVKDGSAGNGAVDTRMYKYDVNGYPTECKYSSGEVIEFFY